MLPLKDVIPPQSPPHAVRALLVGSAVLVALDAAGVLRGAPPWPVAVLNLVYLWIFADNVEDRLGRAPFLAFYAICTAAAGVAPPASSEPPAWPFVASTSGTAGVLGAYLMLFRGSRVLVLVPVPLTLVEVPAVSVMLFFIAFTAPFGFAGLLQLAAGGVTGALLALALRKPLRW